jgi:hypothetical protein
VFGYDPNETDSKWTQAGELAEHNPNKALTWSSMILITLFRWLYGGSDESADLCEPNQAAGKTWTGCLYSANKQPKSICFCLYTIRSDHAWNGNKVSPRHTGNERMGGLDSARHQDPSSWSPTLCARGGCRCRLRRHRPGFDVPFPMRNGVNSTRVVANWSCTPLSVPCRR